ncbi:hypothetical protein [Seonamhaeicola sp. ML3]|uniref:hypothetical protein n=1 Tax=Seonamhaeicola sp. ML3 TaxID=2937786 RepID=UPI00200BB99A|nr:hypothetical protein [Seonamhaeicola sp. ML3]
MAKKNWIEKRDVDKSFIVKTTDKRFADIPEGSKMLIATPKIIDAYVKCIPFGQKGDLATMRNDLAIEYQADKTCPVTASIFLRIVSEAAFEELKSGKDSDDVTPFWRIVDPKSKLAGKLECGIDFIVEKRTNEGIQD